ncbi:MAG TPA: HisA/HisF-related TIM barrel protein [Thermoplasmata archaeon]|nr:HisA/HisF-related TIM barrel protein [Thermoplasmata archaeon]
MLVIPAVDVMDGETVQLVGGDPRTAKRYGDPYEVAMRFVEAGAERLHFVDLDAAMDRPAGRSGASRSLMQRIVEEVKFNSEVEVQVGGGIRDGAGASSVLEFADYVVLGTRAVEDPDWLAKLARGFPGRIIAALDMRGDRLVTKGWRSNAESGLPGLLKALRPMKLAGLLHTRVDIEGRRTGLTEELVRSSVVMLAPAGQSLIWSGGIAHAKDVGLLARRGLSACVVGTAVYEGGLTVRKAMARATEGPARGE